MITVSKELVWRLRGAEQAYNQHYLSVVANIDGNPLKADFEETPWGAICHMSGSPNDNVFNRASASGPGMLDDVEKIEKSFEVRGVQPNLELSAGDLKGEGGLENFGKLVSRGYRVCAIEGIFHAEASVEFAPPSDKIEVLRVTEHEDIKTFLDVYLQGWDYPESARKDWRSSGPRLWNDEKFSAFLASINGRPAGCAQLYIHDGVGYYADACVIKEERRQGCQRALFDARLKALRAAGCELVFSIAEFGSQSASNMESFGLRMATELWHWRKAEK